MMRSLWTAASGMIAQQSNVDVIANNLANINTVGYKTERAEFKSLLYQNLQTKTTTANGEQKPINAQVGLGSRISSITSIFSDGNLNSTGNSTDFAISGDGFFGVMNTDGEMNFTRNGIFGWSIIEGGFMLANSQGNPVLDTNGNPIELSSEYEVSQISVSADGDLTYPDEDNNLQSIGYKIGFFQFTNPAGLEKVGNNLYAVTPNSGEPVEETTNPMLKKSTVRQGYIEASNVQVADEMINLIVAQRAYELNSKAITASDEMLQQANNLRR